MLPNFRARKVPYISREPVSSFKTLQTGIILPKLLSHSVQQGCPADTENLPGGSYAYKRKLSKNRVLEGTAGWFERKELFGRGWIRGFFCLKSVYQAVVVEGKMSHHQQRGNRVCRNGYSSRLEPWRTVLAIWTH